MARPNNINTLAASFAIRAERAGDVTAREALLDASFGAGRHARTCQRLRDGRAPADGLAFVATRRGRLAGTIRLWNVDAGGRQALVLGPWPSIRRAAVSASAPH